jgi:flavodoxin
MTDRTRNILIIVGVSVALLTLTSFVIIKRRKRTDKTKNYIIGDSQTPFIDNASEKAKRIQEKGSEEALWLGGMGLKWLKGAVDKYPVSSDVNSIIINIGTNGGFNQKDDIAGLVTSIKTKFPNAKLYAVKGSWGWGGIKNKTESQVNAYYDIFKDNGVKIFPTAIGKVNDPHGNLPIYKTIGKEIDEELK